MIVTVTEIRQLSANQDAIEKFAALCRHRLFAKGMDYLHPIGTETMAMFIKREGLEEYSWLTFSRPFRNDLWYVLLINAIFVLAAVKILQAYYSSGTMWDWRFYCTLFFCFINGHAAFFPQF